MKPTLRLAALGGLPAALLAAAAVAAQIRAPNATGVAMGHLHYRVGDLDANRAFWLALGGTLGEFGRGARVEFPGLVVLLSEAPAEGGSDGSIVDHVAFRVESLADLENAGLKLEYLEAFPGIAVTYTPEGEKVELFEEGVATNVGFTVAPGVTDPVAERHNAPLETAIASHHLHLYVPEDEVEATRDWYVEHFGATPGTRWRYTAADLPGINLNFSAADGARGPTAGRRLDHIGLEAENLEAFCRRLEAGGIVFDTPYRRLPSGFAFAVLTDPWGTRIELSEGLRDRRASEASYGVR